MSIFKDQFDLMSLAGQNAIGVPDASADADTIIGHAEQLSLYEKLIREEAEEFHDALADGVDTEDLWGSSFGRVDDIKENVDLIVVAAGYLVSRLGPDKAQQAWNLVLETNLAKVRNGAIKREDGKFLQTPEYKQELKAKLMVDLKALVVG